jgi:sugar lactone lactonase YvrE
MIKSHYLTVLLSFSALTVASRVVAQTYTPYNFTTLAGAALNAGLADGQGVSAQFYNPNGIAVDSSGTLYIADTGNHAIRKVSPTGLVSTLATGFGPIYGIALDSSGNIYVSDQINGSGTTGAVKKVSSNGSVSTLVASGLAGPAGLTLDSAGNVYVADSGNAVIRKITPTGAMSVFAGTSGSSGSNDGPPGSGKLGFPTGVAFDPAGNLYIADGQFDEIRVAHSNGTLSTYAGTPGIPSSTDGAINGRAANVGFQGPVGIASDASGNLYIVDGTVIRAITAAGTVSTLAGLNGRPGSNDGAGQNALFNNPFGIAVNSSGKLYVADAGNNEIRSGTSIANQAPTIQYPPSSITAPAGGSASFMVTASGANLSYQWYFNGTALSGATSAVLTLNAVTSSQGGTYTVTVSNGFGSITSPAAFLTVGQSLAPAIQAGPVAVTASAGGTATLSVTASGTSLSYQWYLNGAPISGATSASLNLTNLAASQGGNYTVTVTNSYGSVTSSAAVVTVTAVTQSTIGHLINLSVLTTLAATDNFTVGFYIGGNGTSGTKPILVRASGPSLAAFLPAPLLDDPFASYYVGSTLTSTNDNWGGDATVSAISAQVGAFPFASGSKDAAIYIPAAAASTNSSVIVNGIGSVGGSVLAEVYDATPSSSFQSTTPRFINVSVLKNMGSLLTLGFAVGGSSNRNVLIRAVGPSLGSVFGLSGVASDPKIQLFSPSTGSAVLQSNDNWGGDPALSTAMATSGAFALPPNSLDAAMIANLAPGVYSVQATVSSGSSGTVLIDLYELP